MMAFEHLGLDEQTRRAFEDVRDELRHAGRSCCLGRVISLDRGYPLVCTQEGEVRAERAASVKKSAEGGVAVGDWVALGQPQGHEKALIARVLPRRTELARLKRVGRERSVQRHVLAANVDVVFICQSLSGKGPDFKLLLRQVAAALGCGARAVALFTKCDCVSADVADEALEHTRRIVPDVPSLAVCAHDGTGMGRMRELCPVGVTAVLLGESGVGKSSLVNALVGRDVLAVGDVRASDDRGRHTTVARRMLEIPGGGVIVDAPGLRTLQIVDMDACVRAMFPDVTDAASRCAFRDCSHTGEPGCAVHEELAHERLEAYRYLIGTDWRKRG